jgi:hypothetical protein
MGRHIIVGDVHGQRQTLRRLLDTVELAADDTLVLVGDLVDRGADSAGVVADLCALAASRSVVLVKGNHEHKHTRYRRRFAEDPAAAGRMKSAEEIAAITALLSPEDIAWLDASVLWVRIPEHETLVVHAGLPPLMRRLVGDPVDSEAMRPSKAAAAGLPLVGPDDVLALTKGDRGWAEQMMRVRWVRGEDGDQPRGSFLTLGSEEPGDPYWAELYDGRWGHVYFGHNPFSSLAEPRRFPHATALDLGAVYGNRLVAAVLEIGQRPRFVTVATEDAPYRGAS